ncbi:hypothetical protein L195_g025657 [Trifolium pratense]|uniref:Uncharacterized protein n=1 Tax=Trifolium pratense TaxID=57577 RepID=A0A2K3NH34_TRIPR|nr:hypothetical protein L195_g025657 [Trifolium pratense]
MTLTARLETTMVDVCFLCNGSQCGRGVLVPENVTPTVVVFCLCNRDHNITEFQRKLTFLTTGQDVSKNEDLKRVKGCHQRQANATLNCGVEELVTPPPSWIYIV